MRYPCYLSFLLLTASVVAEPPREVPPEFRSQYTWNEEIPVTSWYFDNTCDSHHPIVYDRDTVDSCVAKAGRRELNYYGHTDAYLYDALLAYPITGKEIGVIGSASPWYEAVVLSFGGKPTSIDYNPIFTNHPLLETMTVDEYENNPKQFDLLLSISTLEHTGLGRYGDPLNPDGDIEWMQQAKSMLKRGGLLILALPVGKDRLFWNAHRQYGEKRLKKLFDGWDVIDTFGFSPSDLTVYDYTAHQPIFVLTPQ